MMTTATYLLLSLGVLGATDILLYHSVSHGIREHEEARHELIVHSLRGPTYGCLFLVVPNLVLSGAWYWALVGLLGLDLVISIWDFSIENQSREFLGGLPTGEYLLHVIMAMVFGALVTCVLAQAPVRGTAPASVAFAADRAPVLVRTVFGFMAAGVLISGVQDLLAARRLSPAE